MPNNIAQKTPTISFRRTVLLKLIFSLVRRRFTLEGLARLATFLFTLSIITATSLFPSFLPSFLPSFTNPVEAYWTNMDASVVVGQSDFSSNSINQGGSAGANTLRGAKGSFVVGNKLIVTDYNNNRVLIFNSIPTSNNASADVVIGQPDFTSTSANQGGGATPGANTLRATGIPFSDGTKLFIPDPQNHRVLIFNQIPTSNNASADVVVGQQNFTSSSANQGGSVGANTVNGPDSVWVDNSKLIIADTSNNRVLIYNSIPTSNNASADVVIGQSDFTSNSANQGGSTGANTLYTPVGVTVYDGKLLISDRDNNRILIYNSIPTSNNASADVVIGQPNVTSNSANQGGSANANTLYQPQYPFVYNNRLFIAEDSVGDTYNNRVLIYNSIPTSNNASADVVIGQQDFTSGLANQGGSPAANTLRRPHGVHVIEGKMIINDRSNQRVLIFTNTTNAPSLGISSLGGVPSDSSSVATDGKLRLSGSIRVDGGNYNIWKIEASVNGGGYAPVTSLSHSVSQSSTHDPSSSDSVYSTFYTDFEPWNWKGQPTGNGDKADWISNQQDMLDTLGYTIKIKGYNNNTDTGESLFYFLPFTIDTPTNTKTTEITSSSGTTITAKQTNQDIPVISTTPSITFSVNSHQRQELKEHLAHYEVWVKKITNSQLPISNDNPPDSRWEKYINNIPIDYDLVKDNQDNLLKGKPQFVTNDNGENILLDSNSGNGRYENQDIITTFTNSSSTITVTKKAQQQSLQGVSLQKGVYQIKITAVDKHNHTQDTGVVVAEVASI